MKSKDKTVEFDLSLLSLEDLITVYKKVLEFLEYLKSKEIVITEKENKNE